LEQEQQIKEAWGGGTREGMLACKPLDFEKPVHPRTGLLMGTAWSS